MWINIFGTPVTVGARCPFCNVIVVHPRYKFCPKCYKRIMGTDEEHK